MTLLLDRPLGPVQPGDDYFALRRRMEIEMPGASLRAKDRAARRALAELDGRPVSERVDRPPSDGCRRQMIVAMLVLLGLMALAVVVMVNAGQG